MPIQVQTSTEPGFASLAGEIVNDIGDLIGQQMRFARAEIKADLRKTIAPVALFALGAASLFISVLFFGLMVVYLLHWLTETVSVDPARLPLWGCHAIVALLFLVAGGVLLGVAKRMWDSFTPLPTQTAQTLKENVEWITNSK